MINNNSANPGNSYDSLGHSSGALGQGNMSFNPYNNQSNNSNKLAQFNIKTNGTTADNQMMMAPELSLPNIPAMGSGNNDTKMSNNEAFLAFLQKNGDSDDEEWVRKSIKSSKVLYKWVVVVVYY